MAKVLRSSFVFILFLVQDHTMNMVSANRNDNIPSYLDPEISKFCLENDTMFIIGNDVKFSDFVRTNGDIYNLCSHIFEMKNIYVFAFNSLIIDTDVDVNGSRLKIYFIAPTWVVVGNRKIAVDGSKGDYIPKATDGNYTNIDGQDGKPGLPGGPGGNLFGIGETFVNGKSLIITANGGIGGTGQYGGNGYNQGKARYVNIEVVGKIWCGLYYDICRGKDKQHQLNLQDNYGNYSDFYCQGLYEKDNMESCSYKIFGWEGEEGGKGGNGGIGGKGGLPGSITVLDLNNSSQISTYNISGAYGKSGIGGVGGQSGESGHNVIYEDFYFLAPPKLTFELEQEYNYRLGPNGSDGYNSDGYEDVVQAEVMNSADMLYTINEYKSWLRESCVHTQNNSYLVSFYKHIDGNTYLRNLYDASEILNEVQSIDEEFIELKTTADYLPFYEPLLGRIYFYLETYKDDEQRVEDRHILCLLYTDILGKMYNFNERADTYLVIQVPPYLEAVKENLKKVSHLIDEKSKFNRIAEKVNELNEYKENYQNQIQNLITKSRQYVDGKLIVEMEAFMKDEKTKMSHLVSDIIVFNERPLNNEQELLRWGKFLQNSLIVRSNLYFIRLINELFSILSDFAEIVSSVVQIGAEVPAVLCSGGGNKSEFSLEAFKTLYNKLQTIKTEEITDISTLLQNILNKTKNYPDVLFDLTEELLIIHKKLVNNYRFISVNALRSDLLKAVKIKISELLSINLYPSGNISVKAYKHTVTARSAFINLNRIVQINTLSRGFVDLYNEYQHNDTKLDTIIEYISKAYNILHVEKDHEDSIYLVIYQLLQRIEDIVSAVMENSDMASTLAIEVNKWKIPLILENINRKSQQLTTDDYRGKSDLIHIIENIGGAYSAFKGIFERIQIYLEQKQLENHIADTTHAISKGIEFDDELFAEKYEQIKQALGSNLVLQNYKKAADTFKQYVFPIADFYFKDIILPSHFNMHDDIADIVAMAITQIDLMLKKVDEYKESMLNGNGIMGRKDFGGREFRSANPFFVWKNEQYHDIITRLLSGNEVTVNADINKSDLSDHAIKLNRIDFYFTSTNKSVQESITYILADFEISVSHLGNSHYRYGDAIYLTTSDSLDISYCFENNENTGQPEKVGGAYNILKNADISVSPYASWKIYLTPLWEDVTFDSLLIFKDIVDLELGGNGYYISNEKIRTLDLKVKKYYKPLDKYDLLYS